MLELDRVSKSFPDSNGGQEVVLDNTNLEIEQGSFVSLLGPSGCGKSTLLNVIAGILEADSGEVRYDNTTATAADFFAAYVFQKPRLLNWRTVEENIKFAMDGQNIPEDEQEERIARELKRVGLFQERNTYPLRLSGGMQQRVGLARALAVDPDLVLMDEPFSALDELTARELREDVVNLWEETGKTILFVTHDINEAIYLADRILLMDENGNLFRRVDIDLPRPRNFEDPQIHDIKAELMDDFYSEVESDI